MVETKDFEIMTIEKAQFNLDILKAYINSEFVNMYMVVLDDGKFVGFFNNAILLDEMKYQRFWREDCFVLDSMESTRDIFREARTYFENIKNRKFPLPVVDKEGQIVTFFVWNQHLEKSSAYLENQKHKICELIEAGYSLTFRNWDEYTNEYVCSVYDSDIKNKEKIGCRGRNWELYNTNDMIISKIHEENSEDNQIIVDNTGIHYPVREHEIIPIIDVSEALRNYNAERIYAWLNNWEFNANLGRIIFQYGYWIDGFCELRADREIDSLFGKKVENLEDIIQQDDVLILVYGKDDVQYLNEHFGCGKAILWNEMLITQNAIVNNGMFQTWGDRSEIDAGRKKFNINFVYENCGMNRDEDGFLLWEYMKCGKTPQDYANYIKSINPNVRWYVKQRAYETLGRIAAEDLKIKNFDMAIEAGKKFYIYGVESHYTNQWIHLLEGMGISYQFLEDEEIECWYGHHVMPVLELSHCSLNDTFVIINKPYEKFYEAMKTLNGYGISMEKHNAICIYDYLSNLNRGKNFVDVCAGPLPQILVDSPCQGYYIIGKERPGDYKIMILGNSTSDSTMYWSGSWPELLGLELEKVGKNVTIYNGSVSNYSSIQECTKLIRDIKYIQPDMVISFSGINDRKNWTTGSDKYIYGLETRSVENWILNEKMMKNICEQYDAEFYCFLQPQVYHKSFEDKYWKLFSKGRREEVYPNWMSEVEKQKDCTWLIDLSGILDESIDVYVDSAHVTTEGNTIIAKSIYNCIIDSIKIEAGRRE